MRQLRNQPMPQLFERRTRSRYALMPPRLVEGAQYFVVAENHQRAARGAGYAAPDSEDYADGVVACLSSTNKLVTKA